MYRNHNYLIVTQSANHSINLYNILRNKGYNVILISTPCAISAGCSRAIVIEEDDLDRVKQEIKNINIKIKGIYMKKFNGASLYYSKLE
ncbi:MAG: DUF3343 domain-containing protein [Clostridium sp.]|nr:DUF3343 domain-containing protein [Clostridium sp.]